MQQSLVLTVIGPDRTGLIEALAQAAAEHGGNWLESRMVRLAGQFAGVVHLHVPTGEVPAAEAAFKSLGDRGLTVMTHRVDAPAPDASMRRLTLELLGHDRPGIVRDVSHALAEAGVSVTELETQCFSAPMSGDPMFRAVAALAAPAELDLDQLDATLDAIAERFQLEIDLAPEEQAP